MNQFFEKIGQSKPTEWTEGDYEFRWNDAKFGEVYFKFHLAHEFSEENVYTMFILPFIESARRQGIDV